MNKFPEIQIESTSMLVTNVDDHGRPDRIENLAHQILSNKPRPRIRTTDQTGPTVRPSLLTIV